MSIHFLNTLMLTLSSYLDLGKSLLQTLSPLFIGRINARTVHLSHLASLFPGIPARRSRRCSERLEAAFPDADDETLMDTLEGMTSLTDSPAELFRSSLEDQSLTSAPRGVDVGHAGTLQPVRGSGPQEAGASLRGDGGGGAQRRVTSVF